MKAQLYVGEVMHRRLFPSTYRFKYRVFSLLIDIDDVSAVARTHRLFSHNRFNLLSFHDRDHGPRDGGPLRPWLERHLARFGVELEGGAVHLLCFPRVLGYGFNPLSLWYCYHRDGTLRAVLCEVRNTFNESHGYLLHAGGEVLPSPVRQQCSKEFHVSPFIGMEAQYQFRVAEPRERLCIAIREIKDQRLMLAAVHTANTRPFTDRNLVRAAFTVPLLGMKVMAAIHWQALKIWLRGTPFHSKPEPPKQEVS